MESKDYTAAKKAIEPIFKRLDNEIKNKDINFSKILDKQEFK
jgi:hypothetical protein